MLQGFKLVPGYLDRSTQKALLSALRSLVKAAPFFQPEMPRSGKKMSVRMTSLGDLGWLSNSTGYHYSPVHPVTGECWPEIPSALFRVWEDLSQYPLPCDSCLINLYRDDAKMGLHADMDEYDRNAPVVSLSLGDTAVFRLGGVTRKAATRSFRLSSGDAMVLSGPMRDAYHGVDRILPGSSTLLEGGGRLNLTLRRAAWPKT